MLSLLRRKLKLSSYQHSSPHLHNAVWKPTAQEIKLAKVAALYNHSYFLKGEDTIAGREHVQRMYAFYIDRIKQGKYNHTI